MKIKLVITGLLITTLSLGVSISAGASSRKDVTRFSNAFNKYLVTDFNAGAKDQNSTSSSVCREGIYLENAAYRSFDNVLSSLHLPKKDRGRVQTILTDNAILQSLNSALAANVNNTTNYNSLFSSVTTAQAQSDAAVNGLAIRLGLRFSSH